MITRIPDYTIGSIALLAFLLLLTQNTPFGDAHTKVYTILDTVVLLVFACDVIWRFLAAKDRRAHLRQHIIDLIVFIPLLQYLPFLHTPLFDVLLRQGIIVVMLLSRSRKAAKLLSLLSLRPAQIMAIGFLGTIGIGTILLMLPAATVSGERTALIDALFTSTSAVCVTGLVVKDTAMHFSRLGQTIIMCLIQIGGLGIMTFSVSLAVFSTKAMDVKQQASFQDALDHDTLGDIVKLLRFIVLMTFGLEAIGAALLFMAWHGQFGSVWETAYHACFHAVSAFCNAGFSTFSDSLVRFRSDITVNLTICLLIIAGGLGFMVIRDLLRLSLTPFRRAHKGSVHLKVQTKIVLTVTLLLIVVGAGLIYLAERNVGLASAAPRERILLCIFQSVSPRTAGFNTMNIGNLQPATLLLIILLMFIGASPGSTGGGIKTTTLATLWATMKGLFKNREQAELCRRTLPRESVQKALAVLCLALVIVSGFAFALMLLEHKPFTAVLFETVSAFGTVGLSTGITADLTVGGKVLIVVLMYLGRLGPLTLAYAMRRRNKPAQYEYADERIMIG